ncbi:MAG: hypothetical protein ACK5VX_04160, partial [Akkermansiaceae bacterium]
MNLKSLIQMEIFTAEAQRSQRSAKQNERIFQTSEADIACMEYMEPKLCFCAEVRNYKSERRQISSTGIIENIQISFGFQRKHNSFS